MTRRVDHTWIGLHSSTNEMRCILSDGTSLDGRITGISSTPQRALVSSQLHFRMLLRMVGVTMTEGADDIVIGRDDPWPDPNAS